MRLTALCRLAVSRASCIGQPAHLSGGQALAELPSGSLPGIYAADSPVQAGRLKGFMHWTAGAPQWGSGLAELPSGSLPGIYAADSPVQAGRLKGFMHWTAGAPQWGSGPG